MIHPGGLNEHMRVGPMVSIPNMALVLLLSVVSSLGLDTSDYVGVKIVQGEQNRMDASLQFTLSLHDGSLFHYTINRLLGFTVKLWHDTA